MLTPLREARFSTSLGGLFILRWALTLVALLASGAAGAAVPETQPARVQGGDASSGNASRSAQPKGQAGRTARRADASCSDTDDQECSEYGQDEQVSGSPVAFTAEAVWHANQLLLSVQLPALVSSESPVFCEAQPPVSARWLQREHRPLTPQTATERQPRAPPFA